MKFLRPNELLLAKKFFWDPSKQTKTHLFFILGEVNLGDSSKSNNFELA